jgi:hypothetical protein
MAKSAMNFRNKGAYQKFLAYGHMHQVFENTPGNTPIKIKGQTHKVVHARMGMATHNHPVYRNSAR